MRTSRLSITAVTNLYWRTVKHLERTDNPLLIRRAIRMRARLGREMRNRTRRLLA